jgi:phosphohistidine phosphatase
VKRLHVLRHAKSSWGEPDLPDHERPLAPRGRRAAARIAEHMRSEGIAPALVLCSTALRTRQTLAALLPVLGGDVEIRLEGALYGAGVDQVVTRLREVDESLPGVLVIGHNPTLHGLALTLTGRGDALDRFPTGALATLAFTTPWSGLAEGGAELEGLFLPRPAPG